MNERMKSGKVNVSSKIKKEKTSYMEKQWKETEGLLKTKGTLRNRTVEGRRRQNLIV